MTDCVRRRNNLFPSLDKWAFGEGSMMVKLNLFQPGKKENHGFIERGNGGVRHVIFLPVRAGDDLYEYFRSLDQWIMQLRGNFLLRGDRPISTGFL